MQFSPHDALPASLPPRSASPKPLAGTVPSVFPFPAQDHLPRISSACSARHPACVSSLQTCPWRFPRSRTASSELAKQFRYYRNALSGSQGGRLPVSYHWQQRIDRWKTPLADFSAAAAIINHVPDFVPLVALSSVSMPPAAMNVARTCV